MAFDAKLVFFLHKSFVKSKITECLFHKNRKKAFFFAKKIKIEYLMRKNKH